MVRLRKRVVSVLFTILIELVSLLYNSYTYTDHLTCGPVVRPGYMPFAGVWLVGNIRPKYMQKVDQSGLLQKLEN